ncbi:hypothetical protein HUJ05_003092 [Dendroctonus ponderosae]|nr:hypothetical protein HUJ05_003092 [Dendroctonus ponderosae]
MNSDFESRKKMVQSKIQTSFLAFRLLKILNIEFAHNKEVSELTWDKVEVRIPRTDKLLQMVRSGIPHSLRSQMWMRMSGALEKKQHSELCYKEILRMSSNDSLMTSKQIEKDLLHIMPTNACYSNAHSTGIPRLRRILRGVAWLYPDIGYCQGLGIIAASLLLFIEEENAFWIMVTIVEDLLPASYYSSTLLGIQADQKVLRNLISNYLPDTDEVLRNHDIELSLITMQWFLTLYANVVHTKILLRIWDLFFFEGSLVLFQITLAMLKIQEPHLKTLENSAQIFNALSDIPGDIEDVDKLLEVSTQLTSSLSEVMIETYRRRHLAYLMADQGALVGNPEAAPNLPKQHLVRISRTAMNSFVNYCDDEQDEDDQLLVEYSFMFQKFMHWLKEQTDQKQRCYDIEKIVGPLFCHLYLDIQHNNKYHEESSNLFFKTHIDKIDRSKCDSNIQDIITGIEASLDNMGVLNGTDNLVIEDLRNVFRSTKIVVYLKSESLKLLKQFISWKSRTKSHMVMLQAVQSWFDLKEVPPSEGSYNFTEDISKKPDQASSCSWKTKRSTCSSANYSDETQSEDQEDDDQLLIECQYSFMYQKLLHVIKEQTDHQKYSYYDLENLAGPLFCSLYMKIRDASKSKSEAPGNLFFKTHIKTVLDLKPESLKLLTEFMASHRHTMSGVKFAQRFQTWFDQGKCKFEKANNFHESLLETPKSVGMDQNAFVDDNTMSIDEPVQLYCEKLSPENNDSKMFKGTVKQNSRVVKMETDDFMAQKQKLSQQKSKIRSVIKKIRKLPAGVGPVYSLAISRNSKYLASGSHDGTARLWSLRSGKLMRIFAGHSEAVMCADFHPNSLYLATGSADRNIRVWCLNNAKTVRLLHAAKKEIYSVVFSPNGQYLASSDDRRVEIWNLANSKIFHEYKNRESVFHLAWSKSGKQLCGGTASGVVKIWEVRDKDKEHDHANYVNVSQNKRRRAKALLDFERHDDDELGFRKNDIITVISQKDEHCWVGELNGLRGWFPAKFVQLLDERSKQYSSAGDDSISETITDLVRGVLCPVIKQVFEHGMKRPNFLSSPCHPWLFIEEAATKEVEKDFNSVYSRLVLCKTYRLDEDGKVLTPEELLYRCVQSVNLSHDNAHAQMDVKLRSLICIGLNEQVLHLWLEVLCSSSEIVQKWYHPWSFIYSPGWVQIKCELRILSQLSFNLNPDWELPVKREANNQPLKEGVRDMLVKHHLFSWDI